MIIAIAMNISDHTALKKSYLLYVRFTYSAWTFKGYPIPYFQFEGVKGSDCFNSTGTKSDIFGPYFRCQNLQVSVMY